MTQLLPALLLMLAAWFQPAPSLETAVKADPAQGELAARPGAPSAAERPTGLRQIGSDPRAAWLFVPLNYRADRPPPLLVLLHGAGGSGQNTIGHAHAEAERLGIIVLAPSSKAPTWDMIAERRYGTDVAALDLALKQVFSEYAVDPERVAVGGFSDGASYALSLGLVNGVLFRRIIAFSPGFMDPPRTEGKPAIFVSHGTADRVLAIDRTSRRIVPLLKSAGYQVDYREFEGGHTVPPDLARIAYEALGSGAASSGARP